MMLMSTIWAVVLVVILALLTTIGVQQWRIHHYKAQATALQGVANTLHDANQTNLATIADLRAANGQWADKCAANQVEARQQAQLSVAADRKSNARLDANIKTLRGAAEHDVSVKTWYEQPVPAGVVRMLTDGGGTH